MKTIRLDGTIGWEIMAANLAEQISGEKEITLIVNSGGGDILEGFAIYNILNSFEGKITAKIDFAASMASVIVMAADKIVMASNSSLMMIHKPWSGAVGDATELRKTAETLDKLEGMIAGIYMERVAGKVSNKELAEMLTAETWLNAKEAVKMGFADSIEKDSAKNSYKSMLVAMESQKGIKFDLSKMADKIEETDKEKQKISAALSNCATLSGIEDVLRDAYGASQTEATAIVATVKKLSHCDGVEKNNDELKQLFENFLNQYTPKK